MSSELLRSQGAFVPSVVGDPVRTPVVVCGGMGGSSLAVCTARLLGVQAYLVAHQDYDLPTPMPPEASCIALSYSGATEESLSFAYAALKKGTPLSIIASGGPLLALAKEHALPYVVVPSGFVPRDADEVMTKAILALLGEEQLLSGDVSFDEAGAEEKGKELLGTLENAVPVFYASGRNEALATLGKVQSNETAKIPAFSNVFPEINHNEMQGFASTGNVPLCDFVAVFLSDSTDDERIRHRMTLTQDLLSKEGVRTIRIELPNQSRAETFLYGWWLFRTYAQGLAGRRSVSADATPLIDSFKEML